MNMHKYALGIWRMLADAIHKHRMAHQGLLPKRFQMHPENWKELRKDERLKHMILDPQKIEFMGVPIVVDARTDQLKMITAHNEVEYL